MKTRPLSLSSLMRSAVLKSAMGGMLTTLGLVVLSYLTSHNFKAEGPDTALAQAFLQPLVSCGTLLQHLGLNTWSALLGSLGLVSAGFAALYLLVLLFAGGLRHQPLP